MIQILFQVLDTFQESVEMSTYLVAFVVCDFAMVSNITEHKVNVSVYAPATMISQANYSLRVSSYILDYYEKFFGVPYPLPKQGGHVCLFCKLYALPLMVYFQCIVYFYGGDLTIAG